MDEYLAKDNNIRCTTNKERFTALNFHGFYPMKFSQENFPGALCLKHLNNAIIWSLTRKSCQNALENYKKHEFLAQQIFPVYSIHKTNLKAGGRML